MHVCPFANPGVIDGCQKAKFLVINSFPVRSLRPCARWCCSSASQDVAHCCCLSMGAVLVLNGAAFRAALNHKSGSSSSGRGMPAASSISCWYLASRTGSSVTSAGASAGAATNSCDKGVSDREGGGGKEHGVMWGLYQRLVANELSCQPQEGLLKVVVGFGRNVVVLQILLPMEGDGLCLHFALLDVDLVAAENDGDVFAHSDEVTCKFVSRCI
jgi:hypothetical protein